MTQPVLVTERLRLEPLDADRHTEDLVALDADPEVTRLVFGRPLTREEVVGEWMPRRTAAAARGLGYWAGYADGRFAGWWCLLHDPAEPDGAELGYRLRRDAWGRGYATEGGRALLEHAFGTVGLARVWAETMVVNTASRGVLEKLGLRLLRTDRGAWPYPVPGAEHGRVVYEVTRADVSGAAR